MHCAEENDYRYQKCECGFMYTTYHDAFGRWFGDFLMHWYTDGTTSVYKKNGSSALFSVNYHLPYDITLERLEKLMPLI
jgi:hypothetical protein